MDNREILAAEIEALNEKQKKWRLELEIERMYSLTLLSIRERKRVETRWWLKQWDKLIKIASEGSPRFDREDLL
jgi:hypothetical protein